MLFFRFGKEERCTHYPEPGQKVCNTHARRKKQARAFMKPKNRTERLIKFKNVVKKYETAGPEMIYDLKQETASMRAVTDYVKEMLMDSIEEGTTEDILIRVKELSDCIEKLSKVIERNHKMVEGEKLKIDVGNVSVIVNQIIAVINRHVTDDRTKQIIAKEIENVKI